MRFEKDMLTLYALTDRSWLNGRPLEEAVEEALQGGATMLQLRDKGRSREEILETARALLPICHRYGVPLIINDSIELARACGADGVHLGQSDVPEGDLRAMTEGLILGLSANTVESARLAEARGADYLGVGAVFGTSTKQDARHLSPEALREITSAVQVPVVAIGGINERNMSALTGCGMEGAAVVSAIFADPCPGAAAARLRVQAERMKGRPASAQLLASVQDIWAKYYDHPFVQGIQNGDLDEKKFRYYNIQDYLYLLDYAKVFAIGLTRSTEPDVMHAFGKYILSIMDFEMNVHEGYMGCLHITEDELRAARPSLANRSYTAYMRAVAYEGGSAEAVAAILACAVSYEYIAKEILRRNPQADAHPFYGDWVREYASERYAGENVGFLALLDRLTAGYTGEQIDHLIDIFRTCSRYEAGFWDMAWGMEP